MDGHDATSAASSPSRWRRRAVLAVVVLAGALWWWWPSLARDPDRLDVLVVGTGEVTEAADPIARRIREEGMRVELVALEPCADSTALSRAVADRSPAVVVVSPSAPCDDWSAVAEAARGDDRTLIALVQPGGVADDDLAALDDLDVAVADPTRLVPVQPGVRVPCLWWDDCDADGLIAARSADGRLTASGAERVARVLTGIIP